MKKLRPIFYDTETTGISSVSDRICEIAAYDPFENRTFHSLINPGCPIPKDVEKIHGISDEMVKMSPSFASVGHDFFEFCSGDIVLIAHNNDDFDRHFLSEEAKRHALTLPSFRMLDSLKWARKYRPDLPRHSLQFLRQVYGVEERKAHRALDDVYVLHDVFMNMIDDLPFEEVFNLMQIK